MNRLITYLTLVLALCAVVFVISRLAGRPINNSMTTSVRTMALILEGFDQMDGKEIEAAQLFVGPETRGQAINRRIAALFRQTTNSLVVARDFVSTDGLFYDGWGLPLEFALTNELFYAKINPLLKTADRPFVIWSAGRNGSNEWGFGDDVFSYR